MSKVTNSIYSIRRLDDLSRMDSSIHRVHPVAKLFTTLVYLVIVVSFGKDEITGLLPFVFYPILLFAFSEIPVIPILKKLLLVCPLIIGIGILNPFFDSRTISVGAIVFSRGWITFLSILMKSGLTVTVSILLLATTGMNRLGVALRMCKVPRIFVLQLLLTYRYLSVLLEEVSKMTMAYALRAPGQKGIAFRSWGSFAGQLLLRTFDRAQRVYRAMNLRGFDGEYHTGRFPGGQSSVRARWKDIAYFAAWSAFFIFARVYNIPLLIEALFKGGRLL